MALTVSTAHGTSDGAQDPRPLDAACIAIAMPRPITGSSVTEMP
jgi:hypothetical protein